MDAPTSSMPSSHVLHFFIPLFTLTTKQHVIMDVFVAIILAYIILFLSEKTQNNGGKNGFYYNS